MVFDAVIEPSTNAEATHVPLTPWNNGSKLNDPFKPLSPNQTKVNGES